MNTLNTITSIITNSEYHLKDHLGNTRVTVDNTGKKVQTNNYYPFGMTFATSGNPTNKFFYNGKELQEETDWLDYGVRMYDTQIGRWHVQDPLSEIYESWSPYTYTMNNPIKYIDVNGMYSTAEWMEDNGISQEDVITIYEASSDESDKTSNHRIQDLLML